MSVRTWIAVVILLAGGVMAAGCVSAAPPGLNATPTNGTSYTAVGPYKVSVARGSWRDEARIRDVPWLIRYPHDTDGKRPVVVFSHGLGGSREGLARQSTFLASHGYVVVHVQHQGSDTAIWEGVRPDPSTLDRAALLRAASDPAILLNRFADIPFALEELRNMADTGELAGRLDMDRVAMSGHSFGALTAQAAAGQVFSNGARMPVDGFRAFIAMSPSGDRRRDDKSAFAGISRPFLMMTGTEDSFALNPAVRSAEDRLRPYRALPKDVPAILVNLTGGDHFVFSGGVLTDGPRSRDPRHHEIIDAAVLAFLEGYLMDSAMARAWLVNGLPAFADGDAVVETRSIVHD